MEARQGQRPATNRLWLLVVPAFFVVAGHVFVLQRSPDGPTPHLTIQGDTRAYVSMIEGNWSSAPAPFKYRVLVPLIAGILPLPPLESLRVITYVSLFASYLVVLLICQRLGIGVSVSVVGLLVVFATTWHLYNYHNPFLTDAVGLMALTIMVYALVRGSFLLFAVCGVVGVLARETTLLLVPAWFLSQDRLRGTAVTAAAVIALLLPRMLLSSGTALADSLSAGVQSAGVLEDPLSFVRSVFRSWGFRWLILLIGMWLVPERKFRVVVASIVVLTVGASLSALVATDTGRMFAILWPVFAVVTALYFDVLQRTGHWVWAAGLIVLALAQGLVVLPNVLFGEQSWLITSDWPRRVVLIAGVCHTLGSAVLLRKNLATAIKATFAAV